MLQIILKLRQKAVKLRYGVWRSNHGSLIHSLCCLTSPKLRMEAEWGAMRGLSWESAGLFPYT